MRDNLISKTPVDKMSKQEKYELKLVAQCLAEQWMDKLSLGAIINAEERKVRDRISRVAKHYPVIFSSGKKGYKMATGLHDVHSVRQTINEINSRIRELQKRKKPLQKFIKEYEEENER